MTEVAVSREPPVVSTSATRPSGAGSAGSSRCITTRSDHATVVRRSPAPSITRPAEEAETSVPGNASPDFDQARSVPGRGGRSRPRSSQRPVNAVSASIRRIASNGIFTTGKSGGLTSRPSSDPEANAPRIVSSPRSVTRTQAPASAALGGPSGAKRSSRSPSSGTGSARPANRTPAAEIPWNSPSTGAPRMGSATGRSGAAATGEGPPESAAQRTAAETRAADGPIRALSADRRLTMSAILGGGLGTVKRARQVGP